MNTRKPYKAPTLRRLNDAEAMPYRAAMEAAVDGLTAEGEGGLDDAERRAETAEALRLARNLDDA